MARAAASSKTSAETGAETGTATGNETPDRAAIEAQIARIRADIAGLGAMMRDYGRERVASARSSAADAPDEALAELQRQLSALEADVSHRVREHPMQSLGLAALAGLVVGLILRR